MHPPNERLSFADTTVEVIGAGGPGASMREPVPAVSAGPRPDRVLVMDDEGAIRALSGAILRRAGYDVTVSSGYPNDPSLADHRELGFAAMVAKPCEVATLLEAVQAVLRSGVA